MDEENFEAPIVNEVINDIIIEPSVKVKKPRSIKQQEALKKMLIKRQEMAVVQRAERKEKRAPKWYKELNAQEREIQEMREVIDMLKEQMMEDKPHYEAPVFEEEEKEELEHNPFHSGEDVYYHPPPIIKQAIFKQPVDKLRFTPNEQLSLLRHLL
jgi:hypothetical protein